MWKLTSARSSVSELADAGKNFIISASFKGEQVDAKTSKGRYDG